MKKEIMLDEIVKIYGFEADETIMFFNLVEVASDDIIATTFSLLINKVFDEEF